MNALPARAVVVVSIAFAAIVAVGCSATAGRESGGGISATGATSAPLAAATTPPASSESSGSSATVSTTTVPEPPPAVSLTPAQPVPAPKVKLGPKDAAVSWAYLKDMYKKDGHWYVVVDYIQVVGPEETLHFVNENPKLRTFPLSDGAKLQLLKSIGAPEYKSVTVAQFKAFQNKSGDEVVEVTPKGGYAVKLMEWWAP